MKPTRSIALIVAGTLVPAFATAQIPELPAGMRLRVDARPVLRHTIVGTLMSRSGDTLVIASSAAVWHRVSKESIQRIDVSDGQSHVFGALKGIAMFGLAPGLFTLAVAGQGRPDVENAAFGVAIVGAVLGGFVGLTLGTESWDRAYPKRPATQAESGGPRRSPYGTS